MLKNILHEIPLKGHTELRAQINTTRTVSFMAGNMVTNSQSTQGGISARVYQGGTYGFASAAEYTVDSVKNCLNAAEDNAAFMDKHIKKGQPPLPALETTAVPATGQKQTTEIPQSLLIDYIRALDDIVAKKYKNLSNRTVIANCLDMEKLLRASEGTDSNFYQPRSLIYVVMAAETADGVPVELYEPIGGFGTFNELFNDPTSQIEKLDELYEAIMAKRDGVYAKAGMHKCILHPDLAGILAHEAVGHTVEADLVLGGSVAASNLNKQVASEMVNMVDFAHTALGEPCVLPIYVDDEGVVAEDAILIEDGILKGYMHSRESARHFDTKPQGNARAFTFSDEPLIRMRNTAILPGKDKLDDMIASIDEGYYLVKTGNGQADTTGEFMFSVELAYEIKNGKIGKAVKETTMSGVAFEMLKTVDMLSDDMSWSCSGLCGKKQPMTVSMGGPAVRCDVNLGGK